MAYMRLGDLLIAAGASGMGGLMTRRCRVIRGDVGIAPYGVSIGGLIGLGGGAEGFAVAGVGQSGVKGHGAVLHQAAEGLVHGDAAAAAVHGDKAVDLGGLGLPDQVADGVRDHHDLAGGDAPGAGRRLRIRRRP